MIPFDYSGWEEGVLKKIIFDIEPRNVADIISCSVCYPSRGDFIKEILRGALYCIDSGFWWKEL